MLIFISNQILYCLIQSTFILICNPMECCLIQLASSSAVNLKLNCLNFQIWIKYKCVFQHLMALILLMQVFLMQKLIT